MESSYQDIYSHKKRVVANLVEGIQTDNKELIADARHHYQSVKTKEDSIRKKVKQTIAKAIPGAKTQDRDYIFLNFVLHHLPHGVVGLLLAVMFSAAMSSMSSELNALASTTTIDIYKRSINATGSDNHYVTASKLFTVLWACIAMVFASLATFAENLIQFVNIVGSLFYGTILGMFLVAFYIKHVKSAAVFYAALMAEGTVLFCYFYMGDKINFLFYNIIGCVMVVLVSLLLQMAAPHQTKEATI
jgi:Na+/proline symporter